MAGSLADYLEKKMIDDWFGKAANAVPATVYLALFTDSNSAAQRDAGTVTEVTGNAYARVAVTNNATNFPNASGVGAAKSLHVAFSFPAPTPGNWGTVTAFGIYDAASAGNLLAWGDLTTPRVINGGDGAPSFAVDALTFSLD